MYCLELFIGQLYWWILSENEFIEAYLEQIDLYFRANDISDEKKVLIFLSALEKRLTLF